MLPESGSTELLRWLPLAIALPAMVAIVVFALRWKARERARRMDLWRKFALDNQLQFRAQPDTWLKHGEYSMRGRIGEVDLQMETYSVRVGKSQQTWMRVQSIGAGPQGKFSVQRRNLLTRIGGLFGVRGVTLDRGDFDARFLVRSTPENLAPEILEQELRQHFARLTQSPRLVYADGELELHWRCGKESVAQLDDAVLFHARLRGAFRRASERGVR